MTRISNDPKTIPLALTPQSFGTVPLVNSEADFLPDIPDMCSEDSAAQWGGAHRSDVAFQPMAAVAAGGPPSLDMTKVDADRANAYCFSLAEHAGQVRGQLEDLDHDDIGQSLELLGAAEEEFGLGNVDAGNATLVRAVQSSALEPAQASAILLQAGDVGTRAEVGVLDQALRGAFAAGNYVTDVIEGELDKSTRMPGRLATKVVAAAVDQTLKIANVDIGTLPIGGSYELASKGAVTVDGVALELENKVNVEAQEKDGAVRYLVTHELKVGSGLDATLKKKTVEPKSEGVEAKAVLALAGKREWVASSPQEALEIASQAHHVVASLGAVSLGGPFGLALEHMVVPRSPQTVAKELGSELSTGVEAKLMKVVGLSGLLKGDTKYRVETDGDGRVQNLSIALSTEASVSADVKTKIRTIQGGLSPGEAVAKHTVTAKTTFSPPVTLEELALRDFKRSDFELTGVSETQFSRP